jgi:uncharacterized protein YjiS (DUF1127 family)
MEHTMASNLTTYEISSDTPAPHGSAAADRPWSISAWFRGLVARAARAIAQELRIRRDMRHLMAMDDRMLKDIGLSRAELGGAVRYRRD